MKFERKIMNVGGSTCLILPPDVVAYLRLENGTVMEIQDEEGKHGKYIRALQKERIKLYKRWKHEHAQGARRFGSE